MAHKQLLAKADSTNVNPKLTTSTQPCPKKISSNLDSTIASYHSQTIYDNVPLQYGRAQNIRVVQIVRSNIDGSICCELSTISVQGGIPYIAVSYEWGSDTDQRTILVGGEPFKVRQNLWQFLAQMQRGSQGTFFWIDAISIQQANVHERNHQVAMMGNIYSNASKVIVWLGAEQNPYRKRGLLETIRSATLDPDSNVHDNQLELRECLRRLAINTYWTRAWILQEFVLGARIELQYGFGCLQEDMFRLFWASTNMLRIGKAKGSVDDENTRIYAMKRIVKYRLDRQMAWLSTQKLHSLEYLSEEFAQTRCSDPRDRIYSLLSLMDADPHPIIPDYTKTASGVLTELVQRYCDTFPVFRMDHVSLLEFMESSGMTRSAVECHLRSKTEDLSTSMIKLESRDLDRHALLWAFMLEIRDPERACRDAIRTYLYTFHQHLSTTHSSSVSAHWYDEFPSGQTQQSDIPSILEMDQALHSRGLLDFDTPRGFVDWIRSCSGNLWAFGSLVYTVRTGAVGRATNTNASPALNWLDDATLALGWDWGRASSWLDDSTDESEVDEDTSVTLQNHVELRLNVTDT